MSTNPSDEQDPERIHPTLPLKPGRYEDYGQFQEETEAPDNSDCPVCSGTADLSYEIAVLREGLEILEGHDAAMWRKYPTYGLAMKVVNELATVAQQTIKEAKKPG